jgi:hypothetical protein
MAGGHVSYADFLERKIRQTDGIGIDVDPVDLNQWMHPWQREIVAWAARRGRAAIWADTGLGKTAMQVEWLRIVAQDGIGLIVAPLAVCQQTIREARDHLGVTATYVREMPTAPSISVLVDTPRNSAWLVSSSGSFGAGVAVHARRNGTSAKCLMSMVRVLPSDCLRMLDSSSTTARIMSASNRSTIS